MSVLSLSYWESGVYWRQNNKHFAELAPQNGGKQLVWRNCVAVTLCMEMSVDGTCCVAVGVWSARAVSAVWSQWVGLTAATAAATASTDHTVTGASHLCCRTGGRHRYRSTIQGWPLLSLHENVITVVQFVSLCIHCSRLMYTGGHGRSYIWGNQGIASVVFTTLASVKTIISTSWILNMGLTSHDYIAVTHNRNCNRLSSSFKRQCSYALA